MKYLDRLHTLVLSETRGGSEPTEPSKAPFDGFEGTQPPLIEKKYGGGDALPAQAPSFWRFRVRYPDGHCFEARTLPMATEHEAIWLWPGATVEPIVDGVDLLTARTDGIQ